MSNIFQNLEYEAFRAGITPRSKESIKWFRQKAQAMGKVSRKALMNEEPVKLKGRSAVGNMYMYFYDPKGKDTLPFYDSFPLTIVIGPAKGGFMGLNLHYLPPILRARMLDALMDITSDKKYDDNTKFNLSYNTLKKASKMRYFKPCFKRYLTSNVRSRFARVPAPEWEIATFLPTQDFQKSSASSVYSDSRRMI